MSAQTTTKKPARLISIKEVEFRTGISCSQIYNMMETGEFPRQKQITKQRVGWLESDIESWILDRPYVEPHTNQ